MAPRDTIQFLVGVETAVENARTRVEGTAQVDGRFEGDLAAGHLVVGSGGTLTGTAHAETAEIHGTVRGVLTVAGQLAVRATGDVEGEIAYGALAIDAGGRLVGTLSASSRPEKPIEAPGPAAAAAAISEPEPAATGQVAEPESPPAPAQEPEADWTVDPDADKPAETEPADMPNPVPARKAAPASRPAPAAKGKPAGKAAAKKPAPAKRPAGSAAKSAGKPHASRKTTDEI